jgi:hypothetical protein
MEIFNLKVVYSNRCFEQLVFNLLYNYILAINRNKNIAGTKFAGRCPSLYGRIEWMLRCAYNFFALNRDMDKLRSEGI